MSEFKFACPVCGQHIVCESDKTGAHMECPNCFREIVVPQPPASEDTKFVLTTLEAREERPVEYLGPPPLAPEKKPSAARDYLLWAGAVVFLAAALGVVFANRDKLFKPAPRPVKVKTDTSSSAVVAPKPPPPPAQSPIAAWLSLDQVTLPDITATGRLAGFSFTCDRAVLNGCRLDLRQGQAWPPEVGASVYLKASRGGELAGQTVTVTPDSPGRHPRIVLRWTDPVHGPVMQEVTAKYTLRVEFGQVSSNRLSGKIHLRIPDATLSQVAGAFDAEIRIPQPSRPRRRR